MRWFVAVRVKTWGGGSGRRRLQPRHGNGPQVLQRALEAKPCQTPGEGAVLIILVRPDPGSLNRAIAQTAVTALEAAGHEVCSTTCAERDVFGDSVQALWRDGILAFCGAEVFERRMFGVGVTSTLEGRHTWFVEVRQIVTRHFPPGAGS
ncbi:MAG: hypothetical protein ABFE07_26285 [Armatimonadia bacterium]